MNLTKQEIEALLDGTTPGPWELDGVRPHTAHVWPVNGSDDPITGEIDIANAILIAAAPDLARTALNALARLEDAEAAQAQALVLERAVAIGADIAERTRPDGFPEEASNAYHSGAMDVVDAIRALAPDSGVEALAALRAELDRINQWRETAIVERDTYSEERDDALTRLAAAEAQVAALRLQLDQKDALYDSGFQAGVKLGWNFGVSGDEAGFQAATASTDHVAELKRIRAALATVTPPADTGEGA